MTPAPLETQHAGQDSITLLLPVGGHTASKRIERGADGKIAIKGYNGGVWFGVLTYDIDSIVTLSKTLSIAEAGNCLAIRGVPGSHVERKGKPVQRKKNNFTTPPIGHHWVTIDVDKLPLPSGMSLEHSVDEVLEHLVHLLPNEFHCASYHWQLSSSAGFAEPGIASAHLWFWLDRPVPDSELKRWAKHWNDKAGQKIIDPALFHDVQAHYIAAPTFGEGVVDPFPVRSGLARKKSDTVAIELPAPATAPKPRPKSSGTRSAGKHANSARGFEEILDEIGDHPGGDGFHSPIIRATASYVATHDATEIDVEELYEVVRARVLAADRTRHEDSYIERMASREHIMQAIMGAFAKYANTDSPRRKSRRVEGILPHYSSNPSTIAEASAQLQSLIAKFVG